MIRAITAAVVDRTGRVRSLVRDRAPDEDVTEEQLAKPKWLARLLVRMLKDLAALKRRPAPRRVDYEDIDVNGDGATQYIFAHGFGGRVRWWVTDCLTSNGELSRHDNTTAAQLVLVSGAVGTITLRIEEVGG